MKQLNSRGLRKEDMPASSLEEASSLPAAAVAAEAAPLAECKVAAVGICTESPGAGQTLLPLPKKKPFCYGPKVQALAQQSPEGQ